MNKETVFQKSRMPLYLQVAKVMRQQIEKQHWRYGEQIPTLQSLEREYSVSRITLRAALDQLEQEGLVRRTRGVGTFVSKDLSGQRWFRLPNNMDELVDAVVNLKIRLLSVDPSTPAVKPQFDAGRPAEHYQRLRRVHYREATPYCLIDIYLDRLIYDLDPEGFRRNTVVPQLAAMHGVQITTARQQMHITVSDEDTAAHLDIGVGDPIADVSRVLIDADDRIVYYAHIQYPAQMIYIDTDLMQGVAGNSHPPPRKRAANKRKAGADVAQ